MRSGLPLRRRRVGCLGSRGTSENGGAETVCMPRRCARRGPVGRDVIARGCVNVAPTPPPHRRHPSARTADVNYGGCVAVVAPCCGGALLLAARAPAALVIRERGPGNGSASHLLRIFALSPPQLRAHHGRIDLSFVCQAGPNFAVLLAVEARTGSVNTRVEG
jgi:hypothetical protein